MKKPVKAKILQQRELKELYIPASRYTVAKEKEMVDWMAKNGFVFVEKKFASPCGTCGKVTLVFKRT